MPLPSKPTGDPGRSLTRALATLLLVLLLPATASAARGSDQDYSLGVAHHWDTARILAEAKRYALGRGTRRAPHRAYALYCLGATRGAAAAAYGLGWLYLNGRGVERDPQRAAAWLAVAANGGVKKAQRLLQQRLARVERQPDDSCPQSGQTGIKRAQLRRWARALAPQYGLDSDLIVALITAESSFNPAALSPKGATGLMQLMPTTARRFGVDKIDDPVDNLRGGMAYLSWLLKRFDGKPALALAAYNAGEAAVDRYQGIPPYRETQAYVRRILKASGNTTATRVAGTRPGRPGKTNSRRHRRLARIFSQLPPRKTSSLHRDDELRLAGR